MNTFQKVCTLRANFSPLLTLIDFIDYHSPRFFFVDPPPKLMAFLGNRVELRILRNKNISTINYESEHQPTFEVYWVGTPKGKR